MTFQRKLIKSETLLLLIMEIGLLSPFLLGELSASFPFSSILLCMKHCEVGLWEETVLYLCWCKEFSSPFQVAYDAIKIPKWSALSEMHPMDYYSSYTKNCTGKFTRKEIKNIRAFYYAMCAETDAMLGGWRN